MKTPYFLIDEKKLNENIESFRIALQKNWPNSLLAYSIKTNSLPWLLKYLNEKDIIAEAVSKEEYDLAKLCAYAPQKIIFNGPIKTKLDLDEAFNNGAIINIDSQLELDYILKYKPNHDGNLGIRINVNPSSFCMDDIGYMEDGFRFGFSFENGELKKVIDKLKSVYGNKPFGLHLHCNSITRSLNVYQSIAKYAAHIIEEFNLNPSYIDIGGGFFGGVPGKTTPNEYIYAIKNEFEEVIDFNKTKLIIEPGSAIIGSVVDLHTSVLDSKKTALANIITTDGSRIHIDPLWKKNSYMYTLKSDLRTSIEDKQIICGYTCMDHDRLMILENKPLLKTGDKIIYHRVGAYTMTFGGPFIRYFPDVYVLKEDKSIALVRKRMDVKDYYRIHDVKECSEV